METEKDLKIEVGRFLTYKHICEIRGEKRKTGKSRKLQLERWKREFDWKRNSATCYMITEVYDEPKEKVDKRGGKRVGSGAKKKLDAEIQYIADSFFYDAWKKNEYFQQGYMNVVYINNDEMMKYFGIYKDLYAAKYDEKVDDKVFSLIADKLREKFRSLVLNRVEAMPEVTISYGIIAVKKQKGFRYIKDEWLEWWLQLQKEYFASKGFRHERDVIVNGCWDMMNEYIRKAICEQINEHYFSIKKLRKITFDFDGLESYDYEQLIQYRKQVNLQVIKEVYYFFLEKERKLAQKEAENKELLKVLTSETVVHDEEDFDIDKLLRLLDEYKEEKPQVIFDESEKMSKYVRVLKNYILLS